MLNSDAIAETRWQRLVRSVFRTSQLVLRTGVECVFPTSCLCCGRETTTDDKPEGTLCPECHQSLLPLPGPACRICAAPVGPYLDTSRGCIHCRNDKFHFDRVVKLGVYRDQLRRAVLDAKSPGGELLSRVLADLLLAACGDAELDLACDVIVPIPHYWTRRFVQPHAASETLAEQLARRLGRPCDRSLLRKVRWTPAQAGSAPSVRRTQQKQAFAASPQVRGLKVLLVDDVLTTGATANEASKALRARGAAAITVAVIARGLGERG